jgi:glyoxylase-like metal-dependent hydrolase (beta-lactamase superfamily II)
MPLNKGSGHDQLDRDNRHDQDQRRPPVQAPRPKDFQPFQHAAKPSLQAPHWKDHLLDQISPTIRRLRAPNPGPMTGTGTNTYILGRGRVAVLDPGPAMPVHLAAIMAALVPGETISHILVTHTHLDHSALVPALAAATGAATVGFGPYEGALSDSGEGIDHTFAPDIRVADGDVLSGDDWQVQAVHTPGHAANHVCFASGDVLFSGDHVMGWSTSLISPPDGDMAAYMASLARLQSGVWSVAYPGHGAAIADVPARLAFLLVHRQQREAAILAALGPRALRLSDLTATVYTDISTALLPAAQRNTLAHVIDLHARNLVTVDSFAITDPTITRA